MKEELLESKIESDAVEETKSGRRDPSKYYEKLKLRREVQMEKLATNHIQMPRFMSSIGHMTFHGDSRIQNIKPANQTDGLPEKPSDQENQSQKSSSISPNSKQKEKENAERLTRPGTLTKEEGMVMAKKRLLELNFVLSPSQPDTLGEINFQSLFYFFVMCNLHNKKVFPFQSICSVYSTSTSKIPCPYISTILRCIFHGSLYKYQLQMNFELMKWSD